MYFYNMIHQIRKEQFLQAHIDDVWRFVSRPENLKYITPKYMNFTIKSRNLAPTMYPGMIISYTVSPILKFTLNWVTEITHMEENKFFVDEQRVGPYQMWHHQHIFMPHENGVIMTDIISYKLPFGIIGRIFNTLFIKSKLESIFNYRFKQMEKIFNQQK